MRFSTLGLSSDILKAIQEKGYETPSPIQAQAIPAILEGRDVMAAAQTGTGKTAGFTLPMLDLLNKGPLAQSNQARALVLTPTRELAAQVGESVDTYGKHLPLKSTIVFGGVKINPQMMKLRRGADVLIATPGRLLDLHNQKAVHFKQLEILVLDEADRMLDMGFIHDIRKILALLPKERQNLLFSATFSDDIRKLAKSFVRNPVEISVSPRNSTAKSVEQWLCPVDKKQKSLLLANLIEENKWQQVLIFSRTKHGANKLTRFLESKKIKSAAIHGNKSQNARTQALNDFKNLKIQALVATDIAARGLDIDQLPQVVNFDLPNVAEDYVHRIGRTGRAGSTGKAVSLVSADEFKQLEDIERLIQKIIPRKLIDGFEPVHDLPESKNPKPHKPKKPKKPKNPQATHRDARSPSAKSKPAKARAKPADKNKSNNSQPKSKANANTKARSSNNSRPSRNKQTARPKTRSNTRNNKTSR